MSQAQLAARSGISQTTIANIESGRNQGSKHLLAIARALNVTAAWLESETGPKEAGNGVEQRATDRQAPADQTTSSVERIAADLPPELHSIFVAYANGGPAKQEALRRLAELPEHEMATLLLVIQSIGAKYRT